MIVKRKHFVAISAVFVLFVFNIPVFRQVLDTANTNKAYSSVVYVYFLLSAVSSIASYIIALGLFGFSPKGLKILNIVLFLFGITFAYFVNLTGVVVNYSIFRDIFATDVNEIFSWFSITTSTILIFIIAFLYLVLKKMHIDKGYNRKQRILFILLGAFLILAMHYVSKLLTYEKANNRFVINYEYSPYRLNAYVKNHNLQSITTAFMPVSYMFGSIKFFSLSVRIIMHPKEKIYEAFKIQFKPKTEEPLNIVLVIGESANAKHQSYIGYFRDTNRYTKKIKNIVYFTKAYSCATSTSPSTVCMLSHVDRSNISMPEKYTNIFSIMTHFGFKTHFISTNVSPGGSNIYFYSAYKEAKKIQDRTYYLGKYHSIDDIYSLKDATKVIKKNKEKLFLVVQIRGSHSRYKDRYPKRFEVFKGGKSQKIDEYDNSILYTDYRMSKFLNSIKKTNTFVYYVGDHGEALGEKGYYGHSGIYSSSPDVMKHVVQYIWVSDKWKKSSDAYFQNIQSNANNHITHASVFNTLLGCHGFKSEVIDQTKNLCNKNVEYWIKGKD